MRRSSAGGRSSFRRRLVRFPLGVNGRWIIYGGLEGLADWIGEEGSGVWQGEWGADLRSTEEGRRIVPDELYEIW